MRQNSLVCRTQINPGALPVIASTSNLGPGGGIGLTGEIDASFFDVYFRLGAGWANPITFTMQFASTPPVLFASCPIANLTVTGTNPLTVSAQVTKTVVNGTAYPIHFEWATML